MRSGSTTSTRPAGSSKRARDVDLSQDAGDPPRLLRTTWRATWSPELAEEPFSRVSWEIEPTGDGVTRLTVVHDELERAPKTAESVASPGGWSFVVSGLKSVLETGKGLG